MTGENGEDDLPFSIVVASPMTKSEDTLPKTQISRNYFKQIPRSDIHNFLLFRILAQERWQFVLCALDLVQQRQSTSTIFT